jgi:hypothetical protein
MGNNVDARFAAFKARNVIDSATSGGHWTAGHDGRSIPGTLPFRCLLSRQVKLREMIKLVSAADGISLLAMRVDENCFYATR